ncbi:energy transducer TonB [Muricauda sp. DJ-13]|uniref:Energy transducer TonB n=2 Tax=Croceivirga thetidis TaxID=2721623 RepID=A0ABX1GLH2_9FLAO|nr:energy transducer TonB [Croceivirga thetidis]
MLTKKKSKTILQLKYLVLLPLVMGMLFYSSCEQEYENEEVNQSVENSSESDAALIDQIQREIDALDGELSIFEKSRELMEKSRSSDAILDKEDFFRMDLYMRVLFTKMKQDNPASPISYDFILSKPLPSSEGYVDYVNRKKVFQILDSDLMTLTSNFSYKIRQVVKNDKNLGPGEFITIKDVADLSEGEIQRVLDAMNFVSETQKFVHLGDGNHGFLITAVDSKPSFGFETKWNASIETQTQSVPFAVIDRVPVFPGCENVLDSKACFQEKIQEHIRKHFNYPKIAQELNIQGRVSVMFTIAQNGTIENIRKRGPHKLLEDEVERIIKRLPKMKPGIHKGQLVKVPFSIPVTFKLSDDINGFGLITSDVFDKQSGEVQKTVARYNKLVTERSRLLRHANENNPVIENLDKQLTLMKAELQKKLNVLSS